MGKKNNSNKKSAPGESGVQRLHIHLQENSRNAVAAIVLLVISIFLLLAGFEKAGVIGNIVFKYLHALFGAGYYITPLITLAVSISFLQPAQAYLFSHAFFGGLTLTVSSLGIIELLFRDNKGGILGSGIAGILEKLFDFYLSLVLLFAFLAVGIIVLFDKQISFDPSILGRRLWRKSEDEDDLVISGNDEEDADDEQKSPDTQKIHPQQQSNTTMKLAGMISGSEKEKHGQPDDETGFEIGKVPKRSYVSPPLSLLEKDSGRPGVGDIKANANIIKRTLTNFGIDVEMDEISIGPAVTRYALKPAEGVKLSKIISLQDNLALALAAHPLRIEAPIPGKSLVGIEIPNSTKITVGLGTLLSSRDFQDSPHPLYFALGKGISGSSYFGNLAKAPHLLIAGATGSGKSVSIHSIIVSLLYRNAPEDLRFIMIDPKRVELTLYNKIPHLLTPVVTDAKKAILVLKWAAKEMERRYGILEENAVRDIQSYHKNVKDGHTLMPYLVIVIDELADIMSAYPRELEAAIVRLAQMSRAVGIHLVLSTQRPSVEVITGLIKANIPSRVALQVPSQIDSRTIIDMPGAEKLLGSGDMLYLSGDMAKPQRIQSTYISETELKKVVKYLCDSYEDMPPQEISLTGNTENTMFSATLNGNDLNDTEEDDELYETARIVVIESGKASTSYLQRRLKVGYARAARLIDILEERKIIGPGDGAKPREVYEKPGILSPDSPDIEDSENFSDSDNIG